MFEFNVTLNDHDYFMFNQYHLFNSPDGKRNLMINRLCMPIICFFVVLIIFSSEPDYKIVLLETIVFTVLSVIWVIISKEILLYSLKKKIEKITKESRLPYAQEAIVKFDDEIIHEITKKSEIKMAYSVIEKIGVTEKAIYIYINFQMAFILPVTIFKDEVEKQKFLEFINSKVDSSKVDLKA